MKYPGPERIDPSLVTRRNIPLAREPDPQSGPTVVPGAYRVTLAVGSETFEADFSIEKDPRLTTSQADYSRQFALLELLNDKLSALNKTLNRLRRIGRQLNALAGLLDAHHPDLALRAKSAEEKLLAIERVLVDANRESPRDVLRHVAGLNDTLVDLINTVGMADMAPTQQAEAVAREIVARVDAEIGKLDTVTTDDVAAINHLLAERAVAHVIG